MDICRILITWTSLTKACPPSSRLPKMNIPLASGETIYMIFGPGPPSFVFISPHISGVSLNMTCQTPQPFIKSSNTRFLSDSSPIIALPCHSVTHCQCLAGWGFDLGTGWGWKKSLGIGTGRVLSSEKNLIGGHGGRSWQSSSKAQESQKCSRHGRERVGQLTSLHIG